MRKKKQVPIESNKPTSKNVIQNCTFKTEFAYDRNMTEALLVAAKGLAEIVNIFKFTNIKVGPAISINRNEHTDINGVGIFGAEQSPYEACVESK
jgi:hypothetical protein